VKALLVGYGKMGKAVEAALIARGHLVVGRVQREEKDERDGRDGREKRENCLESESGEGSAAARRAPAAQPASPDAANASAHPSKQVLSPKFPSCDIAFEFTTPSSAEALVVSLLSKRIPVVSGTTGWDVGSAHRLAREQEVPFLHSPNFSIGVAVLRRAVAVVAERLAAFPEFEPGILERHHAAKKDAPSGTAKLLAAAVDRARPGRPPVPVVSLRQGGQPGEHAVFFEGESETVELVHRARSRALFAAGAVVAAEWMLSSGRRGPVTFEEFLDARSPV
jgi:4-hydroxy-tetrahydrodipicolinate reductase